MVGDKKGVCCGVHHERNCVTRLKFIPCVHKYWPAAPSSGREAPVRFRPLDARRQIFKSTPTPSSYWVGGSIST